MNVDHEPAVERWKPIEQRVALGSFVAVTLLIGVFLLRDASAFVNSAQDQLIGHVGASAGFTIAAAGSLIILRRSRPSLLLVLVAGAAITIVGELAQGLVPNRGIELRDFVAGFGGVLIAGITIELIFGAVDLLKALRIHTAVAAIAAAGLATILVFGLAPETLQPAAPDGGSCPLTEIVGTGERVSLGIDATATNGCLRTAAGGFGLFGPEQATTLGDDTVLVSSTLTGLATAIQDSQRIVLRAEFTTGSFPDDFRVPGTLAQIESDQFGALLLVRAQKTRIQALGPRTPDPLRAVGFAQVLDENTKVTLEVVLERTTLSVLVDGAEVASVDVDPGWVEALEEDDLRLFIGNSPQRSLPFQGVIEWIEIDT